jgi:hypothetical protein
VSTDRLTALPDGIYAGDTVAVTLSVSDYEAPTWSLSWALAGPSVLTKASTANGTGHDLDLTAVETAALAAGLYQWRLRATAGAVVRTIATGVLTVTADLGTLSDGDATPWEVTALAALEASIAGSIDQNMADFMIDGRRVMEIPLAERLKLIPLFESRIAAKSGEGFGAAVEWSFRSAV